MQVATWLAKEGTPARAAPHTNGRIGGGNSLSLQRVGVSPEHEDRAGTVLAMDGERTRGVPVVQLQRLMSATGENCRSASCLAPRAPTSTQELEDGFATMPWTGDHSDDRRFGQYAPESERSAKARPTVRDFEARIRHYNSDLQPSDPTFRAAVILLAGLEYGHNIDLLARKTGYDRAFVARTARRLIDNGVWKSGVTVADWSSSDEASGTFWNDVAVAEGKMCRRIGGDGRIEWAPAGFWNKSFQYVDPGADKRLDTLYLDAVPEGSAEAPAEASRAAAETAAPEPAAEATIIIGPNAPVAGAKPGDAPPKAPRLDEVFRDVIWIG